MNELTVPVRKASSLSSEKLPKSVTMSLSSENSLPFTFGHDGKARLRLENRSSFDVSKVFNGGASDDIYQPRHHPDNEDFDKSRSSESRSQNDEDGNSIGSSSSGEIQWHNYVGPTIHSFLHNYCVCACVYNIVQAFYYDALTWIYA